MSLQQRCELRIQLPSVWSTQGQLPSPREYSQSRKRTTLVGPLARRDQFCDNFTAIGHQNTFAGPDLANVLAQTIFQFPQAYAFHGYNVAS
jgi:hypothetical protein